jgi:hypothetical protein
MIRKRPKIKLYFTCFGLPVICVILLFEVKVNQCINTFFEVNPSQKWVLAKGTEGQIISGVMDYKHAVSDNLFVVQFERGESMNFHLVPTILSKSTLEIGDTVAVMYSSQLQERLIKLKGDLLIAQAGLAAKSTGEKQSLIEEEKKKIKYSETKIQEKKILFERTQELLKKGYVSKEEFDASQWELKQAEIENEIDCAQLDVYLSGSKNEDLQVLRATIQSYLNEIELLKKRLQDFILQSPIHGDIIRNFSKDTLLIVSNTSCLVLNVPVRYEKTYYLTEEEPVRIALKNIPEELTGTLVALSKEVKMINGVQILYARISIETNKHRLVSGLVIGGEIILPKVTVFEYLYSLFDN